MRLFTSTLVVAALLAGAGTADAQVAQNPRSERPYRGLFGGDTSKADTLLTFSASFGGGYDDDIFATDQGGGIPSGGVGTAQPSSTFLIGSASLGYSVLKSKMSFQATGGTGIGHYPSLDHPQLVHHYGSVSGSFQVGRHASLTAGQSETYQPLYFWAWLPLSIAPADPTPVFDPASMTINDAVQAASLGVQQPVAADAVAASSADYYLASNTDVAYNQGLTQRLSLNASYAYRRSDSQSGLRDFQAQSATGGLQYSLAKGLGLIFDYTYTDSQYPSATGTNVGYRGSSINAGVNYDKALSFSRRTRLSFQTGTSAVNDGVQTHYNLIGNVYLTREIGRSWTAGAGYNRAVSYLETFRAPVLSDTASASITGLISRNTQFQALVGASRGDVGYGLANGYRSFYATTGVRFAFTRNVGVSVYYGYFKYDFENGVFLPVAMSRKSNRQTISFSVDFWKPLIQHNRSSS
jgi:hypothetical protein